MVANYIPNKNQSITRILMLKILPDLSLKSQGNFRLEI